MKTRRMADPHAGLLRHLQSRLAHEGLAADLQTSHSERWASATFTGARHRFHFNAAVSNAAGEARLLDHMARHLEEAEFILPDHIVADIALVTRAQGPEGLQFEVEALTVEAR